MGALSSQGVVCLWVLGGVIALLLRGRAPAELVLLGALGVLVLAGAVTPEVALSGFTNLGMATVALLFVVSEGLTRHGGLRALVGWILGDGAGDGEGILARLCAPVLLASGFLNNTAVVAMLVPEVQRWSREHDVPASRLLMPMSFAAILGGTCTLMGTSTNLLVAGMASEMAGLELDLFTPTLLGAALSLTGGAFLLTVGARLMPRRGAEREVFPTYDHLTLEASVHEGSELVGRRLDQIEAARAVGLYPVEIRREGVILPAPSRDTRLRAGDLLVFAGRARALVEVSAVPGLTVEPRHSFAPGEGLEPGHTVEVVLTQRSPLVGQGIGNGRFRELYDAAVLAIAREGELVEPDERRRWVLDVGDRLLVEAGETFAARAVGPDFLLLDRARGVSASPGKRALAVAIVAGMVALAASGVVTIFEATLGAALAMLALRLLTFEQALRSVDRRVVLTIASAIGLGEALRHAGVADAAAASIVELGAGDPWWTLALVYAVTSALTQFITNNAAAVLVLPFALTSAQLLGVSAMPYVIATMMAASASFATPFGYQTNLMVYGAGNYRFTDFIRVGGPLNILCGVVVILLTPILFPF